MIRSTVSTFAKSSQMGRAMTTVSNPYWTIPRSLTDHHQAAIENLTCNPALMKAHNKEEEAHAEVFKLFDDYKNSGMRFGDPIYSVKGESWCGMSPALLKHVQDFKPSITDFGYAEHAFGVQRHRDIVKNLVTQENNLVDLNLSDEDFQVGTWSFSTRLAMFDLGRLIVKKRQASGKDKTPVVVVPSPAWDYAGIYEQMGFKMLYLPLEKDDEFEPNLNTWQMALSDLDVSKEDVALVIVNAQHNPTGIQFSPDAVQWLFDIVKSNDTAHLLIDDAYFAVIDPTVPVTNTLKIWLKQIDESMRERWVATRPFSKQLGCNAIAFGAVTGSAPMLSALNNLAWQHSYMNGKLTSEMMTQFLQTKEYREHTLFTGQELMRRKQMIKQFFTEKLGYPGGSSVIAGPSSYYMLFEIPPAWNKVGETGSNCEAITSFRDQLFMASGVMLSATLFNRDTQLPFVRIHMGAHTDVLTDMLHRFEDCGLQWEMKASFPSDRSRTMFRTLLEDTSTRP